MGGIQPSAPWFPVTAPLLYHKLHTTLMEGTTNHTLHLVRFQILFQDYTFWDAVQSLQAGELGGVVPGGDGGVPLPLAPGNICMVCATTAAPGAWGKEKVEASSRCLPLACSGTPQTLCLVVLQLRPFLLDLRFIPCLHFYLHHAAVEAEADVGLYASAFPLCLSTGHWALGTGHWAQLGPVPGHLA